MAIPDPLANTDWVVTYDDGSPNFRKLTGVKLYDLNRKGYLYCKGTVGNTVKNHLIPISRVISIKRSG